MISWLIYQTKHAMPTPMAQSGFVSSGQGMASNSDELMVIIIGTVFGAFCGLLGGFILSRILRFIGYIRGRELGGYRWVIFGMIAGAVVFGYLAATDDDN